MEREIERKVSLIHALVGAVVGVASPFLFTRTLTFVSVIIVGFLLAYPLYILTRKIFNISEKEFTLKDWLVKGYLYFFAAWILVWTIAYNFIIA
jgi:hypothetical protein